MNFGQGIRGRNQLNIQQPTRSGVRGQESGVREKSVYEDGDEDGLRVEIFPSSTALVAVIVSREGGDRRAAWRSMEFTAKATR
jgi:hypothetical protein